MIVMMIDDPDAPPEFNQHFVKEYWPEGSTPTADGDELMCHLVVTDDPKLAMHFPTFAAALDLWMMQSGLRPDGEPNRPLSAWNVCVEAMTL